MLFLHEGAGFVEVFSGIVQVAFPGGMAVRDFGQHFADDGVFAVGAGEIDVVLVARKGFAVQRQGEFQHASADRAQVALRLLQGIVGFGAALQRIAELARVEIAAEAPVVVIAAAQTVLEILVEFDHRVQGRTGGAGVILGLVGGNASADFLIDQGDVALILLDGHLGPYAGGGNQVGGGLIEIEVDLLQARDDLADALRFGSVFEHVGGEEGVAQRFHVHLGAVQLTVDLGEVEQIEGDLVLQHGEIGAVFRG